MEYTFPKNPANGDEVLLQNGALYRYDTSKKTWEMVDGVGDGELSMSFPYKYVTEENFKPEEPAVAPDLPRMTAYFADGTPNAVNAEDIAYIIYQMDDRYPYFSQEYEQSTQYFWCTGPFTMWTYDLENGGKQTWAFQSVIDNVDLGYSPIADKVDFKTDEARTNVPLRPDALYYIGGPPAAKKQATSTPFVSSYRMVDPADFKDEAGTCYAKTSYYDTRPEDNYKARDYLEFGFASKDLNGMPCWNDYFLNYGSTLKCFDFYQDYSVEKTMSSVRFSTFITDRQVGYHSFTGEVHHKPEGYVRLNPNEIIHIRTPSATEIVEQLEDKVSKSGDTMTGNLILEQSKNVKLETRFVDSGENSNLNLQHDGSTKVYIGGTEVSVQPFLKLNKEGVEDDHAVTKKYVDDKGNHLQQEIIELEEEIDALAPTLERGSWRFYPNVSPAPALFGMYAAGKATTEYSQADQLFMNTLDADGNLHSFNDVVEDSYVEIFSPDDGDYGLYRVTSKSEEVGATNNYWLFGIEHSRSNRPMANAKEGDKCRFKFFTIADAMDPNAFIMKAGDNMEGQLDMKGENGRNKIINLAEPTQDYHAVNKKYVDDLAGGGTLGGQCIDVNGGKLCASSPVTSFINVIKNSIVWPKGDRYLETRPDKRPAYGDMADYYRAAFNLGEHHYYVDTSYNIRRKHEKWDTLETVWTRPTMSTGYAWERMFGLNDNHTIMCDSRHYYKYGSDYSQYMKVYFHSLDDSMNDFNVSYGSHYGCKIETNSTAFTKDGMCFTTFIATNTSNKQIHYIAVTDTSDKHNPKSDHVYTKNVTDLGGGSSGTTNDYFGYKHYVHRVGDELYLSSNESRDLWRFTGKAKNGQNIYGFYDEFEKIEKALPNLSSNDRGTIFIKYLPEVDRYYASCKNAGYLSRAGTGKRLTSETFVNSIKFDPGNWEYTHSFNGIDREYSRTKWFSNNLPIVFNGEVVYTTNAMSENRDGINYSVGPSYLVYNGGEVKQYDSDYYNKGEADFNREQWWGFPYRNNQPQNLPHYYEQTDVNTGETSLKCELQRYSQDKRYPNNQELTWNGVPVALNSATEGQQVTKVSATRPIRGRVLVKKNHDSGINGTSVWAMKSVDQLAGDYDNYNYLFLPNEWIIKHAGIPDGCEAGVNSMVGTWINTSKTVAVECFSNYGEPVIRTYGPKDYDGILIRLSTTFKGDFYFDYEMPDAVTIMGELEEITQTVLT